MTENQVENRKEQPRSWLDFVAVIFAFAGAVVSFGGAFSLYAEQVQFAVAPLWPLPGLILLEWVVLGVVGFLSAYLSFRRLPGRWVRVSWFITGTFIPMIVIGAFSIGPFVLIAFLLFVISTIILAIRRDSKWLESFGMLMLGAILNLLLLYIVITLANINY